MQSDAFVMNDIRPELATDKFVVRNVDGHARLQRVMRNLPSHWRLLHMAAIGCGVCTCVFERDPSVPVEGDFDYFAPAE